MNPDDGCRHCGTIDASHTDDCPYSLMALIREYGEQMSDLGHIAGTRYAHHAGDKRRTAEATLARIEGLLGGHPDKERAPDTTTESLYAERDDLKAKLSSVERCLVRALIAKHS